MLDKAYVEITNICNLNCDFCAGHSRKNEYMSCDSFAYILNALDNKIRYLYLHLMGEPLLHPELDRIFDIADCHNFKLMLTTNGTLLKERTDLLLNSKRLYKISISLHSFEGNNTGKFGLDKYLADCFDFAEKSSQKGIITVFRLWNKGDVVSDNAYILKSMHDRFDGEWQKNRSGEKIYDKLFLEWGKRFNWPGTSKCNETPKIFCQALRDQIGILVDGTVVPCCLDHEGALALGNVFTAPIYDIINCERAKRIYDGFTKHKAVESYCIGCRQPCTYNTEQ